MMKNYNGGRIDDSEILFTTLILMFGEPPTPPILHAGFDAQRRYIAKNVNYALHIKSMMGELGHNPHQGLYAEYMHWCKEEWNKVHTNAQLRKKQRNLTTVVKE